MPPDFERVNMKIKLAALATAALLAGCGGSGSSSTTATTDATTTASTATATALGAASVTASNATSTAYNLVADIGDSWKVNLDSTGNVYTMTVLNSQFGLTNNSANTVGTYTSSTNGSFTTYTLGSAGSITVDTRTKGVSGTLTIGAKTATVAGTGYQATALSKLAGTYYFMYATRDQSNGGSNDRGKGQMKISTDGTTATLCTNGTVNASNTCDQLVTGVIPELNTLTLALSNGVIVASNNSVEWGRLYVHASDLGAALIIDRYGLNASNVLRVGSLYAVTVPKALEGTEGNGTWQCSRLGQKISKIVVNGISLTGTDLTVVNGGTWTETLTYNQLATSAGFFNVNGVLNTGTSTAAANRYNVLPLSSTFVIAENGTTGVGLLTCIKQP